MVVTLLDDAFNLLHPERGGRSLDGGWSVYCKMFPWLVITNQSKQVSGGDSTSQGAEGRKGLFQGQ